jgi:3'-phosphoadenosine 5'-phosphosulfate sulfotransferase
VAFTVQARHTASAIDVLAAVPVAYGDWGLQVDQLGQLGSLESPATLEVLLHLTAPR